MCLCECQRGAAAKKQAKRKQTGGTKQTDATTEGTEEGEEEIPQLVPMETPTKKPKLEVSTVQVLDFKKTLTFECYN